MTIPTMHANAELQARLDVVELSLKLAREKLTLDALANKMFSIFFDHHPEALRYFENVDLEDVRQLKFCKVSDALVDVLKYPDYAETSMSEEVARHIIHKLRDKEYYFALADALVQTIRFALGNEWTDAMEECWGDTIAGFRYNVNLAVKEHFGTGSKA